MYFSAIILLMGAGYIPLFLQINFSNNAAYEDKPSLKIISYNVRLFNKYRWINSNNISEKITSFVEEQAPDILCLQEYVALENVHKSLKIICLSLQGSIRPHFGNGVGYFFKISYGSKRRFEISRFF